MRLFLIWYSGSGDVVLKNKFAEKKKMFAHDTRQM